MRERLAALGGVLCLLTLAAPASQPAARTSKPCPSRRGITWPIARRPGPIDGKLDEPAWAAAAWSDPFVDIEGDRRPRPRFDTRAKMLWDDENFYVAAEMEEPDIWGTLTARDSVIFHDNDFEVFIDPDGDTHAYYELEVNALGTPWDLMLIKPYRDGGRAIDAWDIAGLQVGIDLRGTINRPGDRDDGWTVELAMPWRILREAAPERKPPQPGDRWRVNFSRVEWQVDVADGRYAKRVKPGTKDPLPEANWVWSPQGAINMHMPERWGYVQFSGLSAGSGTEAFVDDPNERVEVGASAAVLSSACASCRERRLCLDARRARRRQHSRGRPGVPTGVARDPVVLRDRRARLRRRRRPHRPGRPSVGDAVTVAGLKAQGSGLKEEP